MSRRTLSILSAMLWLAVLASCGSDLSEVECTSNQQCAASLVCVAGDCVRPDDDGGDASPGGDVGNDTADDAGADTAEDAGVDTTEDVGTDTPDDIGTDTPDDIGTDTPGDVGTDTPDDIGTDTPDDIGTDTPDPDVGPRCGNGVIDEGETCDPGISPPPGSPPCRDDCSYCGDGAVDAGEACDPAAAGAELCALDCSYDWTGLACASCPEGDCAGGATCTPRASMPAMCLPTCLHAASRDCPAGWTCNLTEGVCIPPDGACPEICMPTESCSNGVDDDCDGDVDCEDADCVTRPVCIETETRCDDRVDNDGDGATDCDDTDCNSDPNCVPRVEVCDDGVDNDGDGDIDCRDFDCDSDPSCATTPEICGDGIDNDGDGAIDCGDTDCFDDPGCATTCPGDDIGRTEGQGAYVWTGGVSDLEPVSAPCLTSGEGVSFRWVAPAAGRWRIEARDDGGLLGLLGGATVIVRRTSCTGTVALCASGSSSGTTYFNATAGAAYIVFVAVPETPLPLPFDITLFVDIAREFEQGSACSDGLDNDLDGAIDCEDSNCETAPACTPAGACQSDSDQAVFETLGSDGVIGAANDCAAGCLGGDDLRGCIGSCVSDNTGLTLECGGCYGTVFQCLVDNCLTVCASDPSGPSCQACQEEFCVPELDACTGPLPG